MGEGEGGQMGEQRQMFNRGSSNFLSGEKFRISPHSKHPKVFFTQCSASSPEPRPSSPPPAGGRDLPLACYPSRPVPARGCHPAAAAGPASPPAHLRIRVASKPRQLTQAGASETHLASARPRPDSEPTAESNETPSPAGRPQTSWGKSWPAGGALEASVAAASASTSKRADKHCPRQQSCGKSANIQI